MTESSHRFFDHTGDFGADLFAPTREGIYEEAARAFLSLLTDAPAAVEEREARELELEGVDAHDLLVVLGNELLFLFETEGWLAARVEIQELEDDVLHATAFGEPFDPERHPIARPVKAVTHHGAEIRESKEGWRGRLNLHL